MNAVTPSSACLELVKKFEGYRADPLALANGRFVVGYGHARAGAPSQPIGETEAEFLLKEDLEEVSQVLRRAAPGLTQNQFDALASFGFSLGVDAFEGCDVMRYVMANDMIAAANAMDAWRVNADGPEDALVRRRAAEKALFLSDDGAQPSPSAANRPMREAPQTAPLAARKPERTDPLGLAALGVLGLLLIAMGVTGADSDNGMAYIVFAGPGAVGVAMSVYYLLKKTVDAV